MKKVKRLFALIGVILLIGLYGSTIVCAIFDSSDTMVYLKASIVATVMLPSLLWIYLFIYQLLKKKSNDTKEM